MGSVRGSGFSTGKGMKRRADVLDTSALPPPPPAPNNRASAPGRGMPHPELDTNNKTWFTGCKWFYGFAIPRKRSKNEVCVYLSAALELSWYLI